MPTIPATRHRYNGYTFYSGAVDGKTLLASSFVRRRTEQSKRGFQRTLNVARCREIATYLDTNRLTVPTNIIVSAQRAASLTFKAGKLTWAHTDKAFLVLDGQHRLYAMDFCKNDYPLLVAVYDSLTPQQEVQLFVDINTKQRGVPAALLLDIKQLAGTETDVEEILRQLFDHVSADRNSPLKGLMSPSSTSAGKVTRVTFNSAMKAPMAGKTLPALGLDRQKALLVNYLAAADRTLTMAGAQRNRLTNATMLHAFLDLFEDVVGLTLERTKRVRADDLAETMTPLGDLNYDSYIGSNRPSRAKLIQDMRSLLIPPPSITDDML